MSDTKATSVRKTLCKLRARWNQHCPAQPICLCEEIEPGVVLSKFCTSFLMNQRMRRLALTPLETESQGGESAERGVEGGEGREADQEEEE